MAHRNALALTATQKDSDAISTKTLSGITVTESDSKLSTPIYIAVPAGAKVSKVTLTVGGDTYSSSPTGEAATCEATIFQLCFHARNNKTRYRGKRKHELWAIARCAWINLRRLVIFEAETAPEDTPSGQNGFFFAMSAILKAMSQTFEHLFFCFYSPAATRKWAWTD